MAESDDENSQVMGPLKGFRKFSGKGFLNWKFCAETSFRTHGVLDVATGKFAKPFEPTTALDLKRAKNWDKLDAKAMDILCKSLDDNELDAVRNFTTSFEIWDHLCTTYDSKTPTNKVFVLKRMLNCRWEVGDSAKLFCTRISNIYAELTAAGNDLDKELKVLLMLQGLPPEFAVVRTMIEQTDPATWEWKELVQRLIAHELSNSPEEQAALGAFFSKGKGGRFFKGGGSKEGKGGGKKKGDCYYCGKSGHYKADCYSFKSDTEKGTVHSDVHSSSKPAQKAAYVSTLIKNSGGWLIDSGASCHIANTTTHFSTLAKVEGGEKVYMGNGAYADIMGQGTVGLDVLVGGKKESVTLEDVAYIPEFKKNLFSVSATDAKGFSILFEKGGVEIKKGGRVTSTGTLEDGLYKLDLANTLGGFLSEKLESNLTELELWHKRMGHLNFTNLRDCKIGGEVEGLSFGAEDTHHDCEACILGKAHKIPFPTEGGTRATKPLELIHSDVWGPAPVNSIGGKRYFVSFIDDFSRYVHIFLLEKKSEVFECFVKFQKLVERLFNSKIINFRSDQGGEFKSKQFTTYLENEGIHHQFSAVYTPQQNGVAERYNRTVVEMARSMLIEGDVDVSLWGEAIHTAVYTRNRCPTSALKGKTPFTLWHDKKPDVGFFRVFGSKAFVLDTSPKRNKLMPKSLPGVFVGYDDDIKGYRVWIKGEKNVRVSRNVIIKDEGENVLKTKNEKEYEGFYFPEVEDSGRIEGEGVFDEYPPTEGPKTPLTSTLPSTTQNEPVSNLSSHSSPGNQNPNPNSEANPELNLNANPNNEPNSPSLSATITGGGSIDTPPSVRGGRNLDSSPSTETDDEWLPGNRSGSRRGNRGKKKAGNRFSFVGLAFLPEPLTYTEALSREDGVKWGQACDEEITSIMKNNTWELVDLPEGRKAIGCKWVFKLKMNPDNTIDRYKARLVAKGYSQKEGIDYDETFSPVVKYTSIRIFLTIAASNGMLVHQMDVKTAFLNGKIEEDIYMTQPEGYIEPGLARKVCKLFRGLYGLKQASRVWNIRLHEFLIGLGFVRLASDTAVYVMWVEKDGELLIVAVYVDDMGLACKILEHILWLKRELSKEFDMKDLGEMKYILGIELERDWDKSVFRLSQASYIRRMITKFNLEDANGVSTPQEFGKKLSPEDCPTTEEEKRYMDKVPYREAVGSLLYAANCTRPDIATSVSNVSRYLSNPGRAHWEAVKRILRYLKETEGLSLTLGGNEVHLEGFSDADWGADLIARRSRTGFVFMIGMGAVAWESKLQHTAAQSTMEAEYMAVAMATKEALWIRKFLSEVGQTQLTSTPIWVDNQASISLIQNPVQHSKAKHMDLRMHFIRDEVQSGSVVVKYVPDKSNVADFLTKPLNAPKFEFCRNGVGLK
jgi:Reverse transcriptase (RNA-dependent DNA polymerase)/gag-polypeptide of LTR copia-type/Integrase core domain/GAG-pre-integrase domain